MADFNAESYAQMFMTGIVCYALTAMVQMVKISRIPKTDALKNVEVLPVEKRGEFFIVP